MTARNESAEVACLDFVRLRGLLRELPYAHPARPALCAQLLTLERNWQRMVVAPVPSSEPHFSDLDCAPLEGMHRR